MRPDRQQEVATSSSRARDSSATRARLGVFGVFWLCGVVSALWSAALPAVDARLHLGATRIGSVLLLAGIGAMVIMPLAGRVCDRWTSRTVTRVSASVTGIVLVGPSLATSYPVLLATVFIFGASLGTLDVAMNTHAVEVEKRYGKPILSAFHGTWSLGGVVGGAVVAAGLHAGIDIRLIMAGGALVCALLFVVPGSSLLRHQRPVPAEDSTADRSQAPMPRGLVLLLGTVALAAYVSEGAATDWAALHADQMLTADPASASLAYTAFAATMTVVRLVGDQVHHRLGSARTIRLSGVTATVGYGLVLLAPNLPGIGLLCGYLGWALVGLGLATVVPVLFSAAGSHGAGAGQALSWVTAIGYVGLLAGPAVIGPVSEATSLGTAMLLPTGLVLLIAFAGPFAVRRAKNGPENGARNDMEDTTEGGVRASA